MSSLVPLVFQPLPLSAVQPTLGGWIQSELTLSANGLAGRQYDFYDYVKNSSWLGHSSEYSSLNEGLPYWFNGVVPMAYTLDDARLKSQVHTVADYVLTHQTEDGWLGPETGKARMFWGRFPLILGLTNLADANSTWTDPVVGALHRFNRLMNNMLQNSNDGYIFANDGAPYQESDYVWGRVRYQDMMISLIWLLEHHPQDSSDIILDNLNRLHTGAIKWEDYWVDGVFIKDSLYNVGDNVIPNQFAYTHGVNVAEGLKSAAVTRRFTHNDSLIQTQYNGIDWTWQYHGQSSGAIIADEILDGLEPYAGTELCGVVEAIYSLSYVYQALGRNSEADRAELAAFNALPTMLTSDWWARQYLSQANQPLAIQFTDEQNPFRTDGPYSNVFGLEPNYPCCTVNHPQGLPKFVMNSYVKNGDSGLVHALLGPTSVSTTVNGGQVEIKCATNYPFGDQLSYSIYSDTEFDFYVRKPEWAYSYALSDDAPASNLDTNSGLIKISITKGTTNFVYTPAATVRVVERPGDSVAIYRGAVLYAIPIDITAQDGPPVQLGQPLAEGSYPQGAGDHQYTNASAWNWAIDTQTLQFANSGSLASPLFTKDATGNSMTATGCQIAWPLFKGRTPGAIPAKRDRQCLGPKQTIRLVPYGAAKLHMSELPTI